MEPAGGGLEPLCAGSAYAGVWSTQVTGVSRDRYHAGGRRRRLVTAVWQLGLQHAAAGGDEGVLGLAGKSRGKVGHWARNHTNLTSDCS
ncbi:hypothetical protein FH972_022913 [Carpinus fangiana]|uniref:Uncharacterized protein n=1 Tax=Carpinus fangiana TaxID=176857 RepID=A0A5N6KUA6_9ROSI|nr:hypothetical protein FH972_022913 [Carpinus fangiana]